MGGYQQRGYLGCGDVCAHHEGCDTEAHNTRCAALVGSLQLSLLIYSRMFLNSHGSEWEDCRAGALEVQGMSEEVPAKFA